MITQSFPFSLRYANWIKRFILFHSKRHPDGMGAPEVRRRVYSLSNGFILVSRPSPHQTPCPSAAPCALRGSLDRSRAVVGMHHARTTTDAGRAVSVGQLCTGKAHSSALISYFESTHGKLIKHFIESTTAVLQGYDPFTYRSLLLGPLCVSPLARSGRQSTTWARGEATPRTCGETAAWPRGKAAARPSRLAASVTIIFPSLGE